MIEKFLLLCSGNSGKMQLLIIQRQTSLNPRNYVMHLTQEMLLTKVHVLVKHKILFINHFKLNVDINNLIALHCLHYFLAKKQLREDVSNYCILPLILMQAPVSDS